MWESVSEEIIHTGSLYGYRYIDVHWDRDA